jgi:hypothetical protein
VTPPPMLITLRAGRLMMAAAQVRSFWFNIQ